MSDALYKSNAPITPQEANEIADSVQAVTHDASAAAAFRQFSGVAVEQQKQNHEPLHKVLNSVPLNI